MNINASSFPSDIQQAARGRLSVTLPLFAAAAASVAAWFGSPGRGTDHLGFAIAILVLFTAIIEVALCLATLRIASAMKKTFPIKNETYRKTREYEYLVSNIKTNTNNLKLFSRMISLARTGDQIRIASGSMSVILAARVAFFAYGGR